MAPETQPWRPFVHNGTTYALDHLAPRTMIYVVPPKGEKSELRFTVDVTFGTHCFTRGIPEDGLYDRALHYRDGRELRVFDFRRYELSKSLPAIVETLVGRDCKHGDRGNFFTIVETDENGSPIEYDVFFTVTKSTRRGRLSLFLQSAYVGATLPARQRRIRFEIILFNTLNRKTMR